MLTVGARGRGEELRLCDTAVLERLTAGAQGRGGTVPLRHGGA
jgi:hypothetical protein